VVDLVKLKELETWLAQKSHVFFDRGEPSWLTALRAAIPEIDKLKKNSPIMAEAIKRISDMELSASLEFRAGEAREIAREAQRKTSGQS